MYIAQVPYHNYLGKPNTGKVHFQLELTDLFKVFIELAAILDWRDSLEGQDRELTNEEMVSFFNNFETIVMESFGVPSADGERFVRDTKWEFNDSKLKATWMESLVSDIGEIRRFLNDVMPKGMEEMVRKQAESLEKLKAEGGSPELQAEIERLQALQNKQLGAQLEGVAAVEGVTPPAPAPYQGLVVVPDPSIPQAAPPTTPPAAE